ncbi:MAG: hypothetical protein KJZ54_08840 [Phycisphaerales bacterium]|nr:hypothetical protein [Phycisphaerales bacterium]
MPHAEKFVRARARTRCEVVADEIAGHGFPLDVADRLASHLVRADCLPQDGQILEAVRGLFWNIFDEWSKSPDPDILTMLVFRSLISREYGTHVRRIFQEEPWTLDAGRSRRFAELCASEDGMDFTGALAKTIAFLDAHGDKFRPGLDMAQVLWRHKLVEPERLIDASSLVAIAKSDKKEGGSWSGEEQERIRRDVRAPAFWIAVDPAAAIRALRPALESASDEELARLARGINICANRSLSISGFHSTPPPIHEVTKFAFDVVDRRIGDDLRAAHPQLRHTWLHLWRELWWKYKVERDPARDARLLKAADLEIGSLRPIVERADLSAFAERLPVFDAAVTCAFELASLWEGFRPLLLAFRKLPVPGVATDLRWWTDQYHRQPPLPEPWSQITSHLVSSFHTYAKAEQEKDADLSSFRTAFARFCLDRLKSSKTGDGPREDNPIWRMGYINAVVALKINPEGKGHNMLNRAAEHDPDPEIRSAARAAYRLLRHGPRLKAGESPRRCVLLAFWYLRQAHLAALGITVDERGANRIREEEIRHTTEQERQEHTIAQAAEVSPPSGPETGPSLM